MMAEKEQQAANPHILGAIILGEEVLKVIRREVEKKISINVDIGDLHSIIEEEVLKREVVELIKQKEKCRKGIDRRQQDIEVSVDRRKGTERQVKERRSEFKRRLQLLEVSIDRRTYDRRRAWV